MNPQTGTVQGKTITGHTSEVFVAFLAEVVANCVAGQEMHIILVNLAVHKTRKVMAFLEPYPPGTLHLTQRYSSWLNQVELWFSKVQRDVLARGILTATTDLARKLRRNIDA